MDEGLLEVLGFGTGEGVHGFAKAGDLEAFHQGFVGQYSARRNRCMSFIS